MSSRLEMLQVARLAPLLLGRSSPLVADYVRSAQTAGGGFADRAGQADLYYTVFGLECLVALQQPPPVESLAPYLDTFGAGEGLDLVHLCCLARCRCALGLPGGALAERIAAQRDASGGYGSLYRCFLACGALQDLQLEPPADLPLERYRAADGGYADRPGLAQGLVPSTAAAVVLARQLGRPREGALVDWLLGRLDPQGGFRAAPAAPLPDLLSTAVALHALSVLGFDPAPIREACLDFVDTLWSSRGAFCGSWADDTFDVEYTWYGLLALGHLSA